MINEPFDRAVRELVTISMQVGTSIVLPALLIVIGSVILTSMVVNRGLIFSLDPIMPKAEKVSLTKGFKRLFALRNLIEFGKSIFKVLLIVAVILPVALLGIGTLLKAPYCGIDCIVAATGGLIKPIVVAVLLVFGLTAIVDMGLQSWLFGRDLRMTKTEFKRELKDMEGDPKVRQERKRLRQELVESTTRLGMDRATVLVIDGPRISVGLRYVRGETPVPVLVVRGRKERAETLYKKGVERNVPIVDQPEFAMLLMNKVNLGDYVPEEMFELTAQVMIKAKLV
jgi:type III secretion protein U